MRILSVFRLTLTAIIGLLLAACSSVPTSPVYSQKAPGSATRPVLSDSEATQFVASGYFAPITENDSLWTPHAIHLPAQPDFIVGPVDAPQAQFNRIQDAINAAIKKHTIHRQYIAVMPGKYEESVFIPKAPASLTLYGTGQLATDTIIALSIDGSADRETWHQTVNPDGQYTPGDPAWYMFHSCAQKQSPGVLCSAVLWSQNNGLQLQNLTIENAREDSADDGDHPAVALRNDGDRVQIDAVNLLSRQNTFLLTNSSIDNQLSANDEQPRVFVRNSYIEGDVDIVAGRASVVFEHSTFRLVHSPARQGSIFAPATLASVARGFLVSNSQLIAPAGSGALLGRNWDAGEAPVNGQLVIRDSSISSGFNVISPWGEAAISGAAYTGNAGSMQNDEFIRDVNDKQFNRLWEYHNTGDGTTAVAGEN